MDEKKYHNKDLKENLITNGLQLLNEVGYQQFSMRKVSSMCKVSHNAPYRHFADKEDLIKAILGKAVKEFQEALSSAVNKYQGDPLEQIKNIGINYVIFFKENPEYLNLFFQSELKGKVYVKDNQFSYEDAHLFGILINCFTEYYKSIGKEQAFDPIIVLEFWSMIHGLTTFITNKKVIFLDDDRKYIFEIIDRHILMLKDK